MQDTMFLNIIKNEVLVFAICSLALDAIWILMVFSPNVFWQGYYKVLLINPWYLPNDEDMQSGCDLLKKNRGMFERECQHWKFNEEMYNTV